MSYKKIDFEDVYDVELVDKFDSDYIKHMEWRQTQKTKPSKAYNNRKADRKNHKEFFRVFRVLWSIISEDKIVVANPNESNSLYYELWCMVRKRNDVPKGMINSGSAKWHLYDMGYIKKPNKGLAYTVCEHEFMDIVSAISGVEYNKTIIKMSVFDFPHVRFKFMDGFFKVGRYNVVIEYKMSPYDIQSYQVDDYVKCVKKAGYRHIKRLMVLHDTDDEYHKRERYQFDEKTAIEKITQLAIKEAAL